MCVCVLWVAVQDGQTETLLATEPANQDDSGDDDQAADVNEDVDQGSAIIFSNLSGKSICSL